MCLQVYKSGARLVCVGYQIKEKTLRSKSQPPYPTAKTSRNNNFSTSKFHRYDNFGWVEVRFKNLDMSK